MHVDSHSSKHLLMKCCVLLLAEETRLVKEGWREEGRGERSGGINSVFLAYFICINFKRNTHRPFIELCIYWYGLSRTKITTWEKGSPADRKDKWRTLRHRSKVDNIHCDFMYRFCSVLNLRILSCIVLASCHVHLVAGSCSPCFLYLGLYSPLQYKYVASPCEYFVIPVYKRRSKEHDAVYSNVQDHK